MVWYMTCVKANWAPAHAKCNIYFYKKIGLCIYILHLIVNAFMYNNSTHSLLVHLVKNAWSISCGESDSLIFRLQHGNDFALHTHIVLSAPCLNVHHRVWHRCPGLTLFAYSKTRQPPSSCIKSLQCGGWFQTDRIYMDVIYTTR